MREDEIEHGQQALEAGGAVFPEPIKQAMVLLSKVMTKATYKA
jgi:ubiquinone biosynthesis monooxygenase Coq7